MNEHEAALRNFIDDTLSQARQGGYKVRSAKNWIFGAISFCYHAGLISTDAHRKFLEEYSLLE